MIHNWCLCYAYLALKQAKLELSTFSGEGIRPTVPYWRDMNHSCLSSLLTQRELMHQGSHGTLHQDPCWSQVELRRKVSLLSLPLFQWDRDYSFHFLETIQHITEVMNITHCVLTLGKPFGKSKAYELKAVVKWECVVSFWAFVINKIHNYLSWSIYHTACMLGSRTRKMSLRIASCWTGLIKGQ